MWDNFIDDCRIFLMKTPTLILALSPGVIKKDSTPSPLKIAKLASLCVFEVTYYVACTFNVI